MKGYLLTTHGGNTEKVDANAIEAADVISVLLPRSKTNEGSKTNQTKQTYLYVKKKRYGSNDRYNSEGSTKAKEKMI